MKFCRISKGVLSAIVAADLALVALYPAQSDPPPKMPGSGAGASSVKPSLKSANAKGASSPEPAAKSEGKGAQKPAATVTGSVVGQKKSGVMGTGKPNVPASGTVEAGKPSNVLSPTGAKETSLPSTPIAKTGPNSTSLTTANSKTEAKNASSKQPVSKSSGKAAKRKHAVNKDELIPPPPPVQPSLLLGPDFAGIPFGFEGLNKDELSGKAKDLAQQLKDMQDVVRERQERTQEAKDKAARFKPLFDEGVVSRHELEAAEKEALEADREFDRINRRLSEMQKEKQAVEGRLNDFNKRGSYGSYASKGKKKK